MIHETVLRSSGSGHPGSDGSSPPERGESVEGGCQPKTGNCEIQQLEASGGEGKHLRKCPNAKGEEGSEWVQSLEQKPGCKCGCRKER